MIQATTEIGGAALRNGVTALSPFSSATSPTSAAETAAAGNDFAAVFKQLATDAIGTLKNGEAASIQGIRGQLGTQDVVEAVMAAEQTLQAAVAVRDKVVSAYLELTRMQI